jgi:hypothetical protein
MFFSVKSQYHLQPLFFSKKENIGKWISEQSKHIWNENHPTNRLDYLIIDILKGEPPKNLVLQDRETEEEKKEKKERLKLTPHQQLDKLNYDIQKTEERLKKKVDKRALLINSNSLNL